MAYTAPPARTSLADTYPNPSNATFRTGVGTLHDYTTGLLGATGNPFEARDLLGIASAHNQNLWINSDMALVQWGVGTRADATYSADQTMTLCETGNLTTSQLAQPTDGIPYALRMLQPDASPKRMGCLQIVEAKNCLAYRGGKLVFAAKVRCSAAVTIRGALVAWTSTADSPTRDPINTWSSTNYTAGNFFVANTSPIAVGSQAVGAATWTDVTVSSASVGGVVAPSAMNNLYMLVWTDTAVAQNVTLDVSCVRAGTGTVSPLWTPPDAAAELARCQRYYETGVTFNQSYAAAGLAVIFHVPMIVTKRIVGTIGATVTNNTNSSSTVFANVSTEGFNVNYTITATGMGSTGANWQMNAAF